MLLLKSSYYDWKSCFIIFRLFFLKYKCPFYRIYLSSIGHFSSWNLHDEKFKSRLRNHALNVPLMLGNILILIIKAANLTLKNTKNPDIINLDLNLKNVYILCFRYIYNIYIIYIYIYIYICNIYIYIYNIYVIYIYIYF